jgi:hypothetical protein
MSTMVVRWVFLIAWTLHGFGHVAGVLGAFLSPKASGFKVANAWILPGEVLVTGPVGKVWSLFWVASLVLIAASSYGLLTGAEWWRQIALYGAIASLVAIVPWARTVPAGALAGALFDIVVIAMVLVPIESVLALVEK